MYTHPKILAAVALTLIATTMSPAIPSNSTPSVVVSTAAEPVAPGKFQPTWDSLRQYEVPDWFRDAKFGIWAHWGPQCEPERGDWYARLISRGLTTKFKKPRSRPFAARSTAPAAWFAVTLGTHVKLAALFP